MESMQTEQFTAIHTEGMVPEMTTAESALTELSDADLDDCSGGLSLGDFGSLFNTSSSFFGQERLSFGQANFAGPNGAGSISSLDFERTISGANQSTSLGK